MMTLLRCTPRSTRRSARRVLAWVCALGVAACSSGEPPASAPASPAAAPPAAALGYSVVTEGTGAQPRATDVVKVHYRGTFPDGREFDSSYGRGQPAEFPLDRVIKCWTEGVQRMKVGGKAKLVCPPGIAYGSRGAGSVVPPDATLHFEIELLDIVTPR